MRFLQTNFWQYVLLRPRSNICDLIEKNGFLISLNKVINNLRILWPCIQTRKAAARTDGLCSTRGRINSLCLVISSRYLLLSVAKVKVSRSLSKKCWDPLKKKSTAYPLLMHTFILIRIALILSVKQPEELQLPNIYSMIFRCVPSLRFLSLILLSQCRQSVYPSTPQRVWITLASRSSLSHAETQTFLTQFMWSDVCVHSLCEKRE